MIDRQLDKIGVLLLLVSEQDEYREQLFYEYNLYRSALETIPRDRDVPDILLTNVNSFEQRLKKYVLHGKSNNPIEELIPTLSSKINSAEEKEKIIKMVNTNVSYLTSRKSQLDVLKAYLDGINFEDNTIEDIEATIKYVEQSYLKTNIYSGLFEQQLAQAKYFYIIRLMCDSQEEKASEIISTFDWDMVLFIHTHHKDTVKKLLSEGKSKLAMDLNTFLTELPTGREKEIEFWNTLFEIEKPRLKKSDIVVNEENSVVVNSDDKALTSADEEETPLKKERWGFLKFLKALFSKNAITEIKEMPRLIEKDHFMVYFNQDNIEIKLTITNFMMDRVELEKLNSVLANGLKRNRKAFLKVTVNIHDTYGWFNKANNANLNEIIYNLTNYCNITTMNWYGRNDTYELDEGAFSGLHFCHLALHDGTWTIGKGTFSQCWRLEKVDLSDAKIIRIEDGAFFNCTSLKEVILPILPSEYLFGNGVFENCKNLTTINWPNSIRTVSKNTFKNCIKLQNLGTNSFDEIEEGAFEGCESFNELYFPGDIRKIGAKAFYKCWSLTHFSFDKCRDIGDYAFAYSGLEKATITFHLHQAGVGVFKGSAIQSATIEQSLTLPHETFMECENLTRVKLDDMLSVICDDAFNGCIKLEKIDIPYLVSYLGARAFKDCESIRKIELSKGCLTILEGCFMGCSALTKFVVPMVDTIDKEVFSDCTRLEEVSFEKPENVLRIDDKAFENCERLNQITIPPNVQYIGAYAFANTDIGEIVIPEACRELGEGAFCECQRLTKVQLSSYIRFIGKETFKCCYILEEIDMSKCFIDSIGKEAFDTCESLKRIVFGNGLRSIHEDTFNKCNMIEEIVVPISLLGISIRDVEKKDSFIGTQYGFLKKIGIFNGYNIDSVDIKDNIAYFKIHSQYPTDKISTIEDPYTY